MNKSGKITIIILGIIVLGLVANTIFQKARLANAKAKTKAMEESRAEAIRICKQKTGLEIVPPQ